MASDIKLESNIPVPERKTRGVPEAMKQMEVGQSFLIGRSYRAGIYNIAKKVGIKITIRDEGQKIRIWRSE